MKIKSRKWLFVLVPLLLLAGGVFYIYADSVNYWKVTDPRAPGFDPDKFVFNDYRNNKELAEALKLLIYPGMPREEAEKFLDGSPDKRGGRDMTNDLYFFKGAIERKVNVENLRKKSGKVILYGHGGKRKLMNPLGDSWSVTVFYDGRDRVMQIIVRNEVIFEEGKL